MSENKLSLSESGDGTNEGSEPRFILNVEGISVVEEGVLRKLVSTMEGGGYRITSGIKE